MKEMLNVALPKGRLGEKVYGMFKAAGFPCPSIEEQNRKLIFENEEVGVRYFWVKPSDVAIYVERGAADIGVAGKDILLEYRPKVYELFDLDVGKCRMAVAAQKTFRDDPARTLRVATKFSRIARDYYAGKGRDIDVIHLNGSIEIAPILGAVRRDRGYRGDRHHTERKRSGGGGYHRPHQRATDCQHRLLQIQKRGH